MDALDQLRGGRMVGLIVDIRALKAIDRAAREFFAGEEHAGRVKALCLIVDSMASQMIGNLFISFHRPKVPTHLFHKEQEGLEWIENFFR